MQYNPIFYQRLNKNPIHKFTIIGERHSGTNWLERILTSRLSTPLTWEYGSKHFINYNLNQLASAKNTLFVCITRDIYQWIGGFYKLPHHVDKSIAYDLDKFLLSEWKNEIDDYDYLTHKPYKNIFCLRKSKLEFLYIFLPNIVDSIIITRYEDLLVDPENIVSFISTHFDISTTNVPYYKWTQPRPQHPYLFLPRIKDIINQNTDWKTESIFHYDQK